MRSQNVGWGTLLLGDLAYIDDATHATFPDTEIRVDDVLLNITGASIGRCAVADARLEGGNVNQHVCIIRVERGLRPRFLNFFLLSDPGQRQIDNFQAGGNRQGLNFSQVRSIRVPVPGESEQRAIEGALSDMDELLGGLDQLIAKKRNLKQAAMQQLLSGQIRLPGFTGKWEIKRLGDVSDCDPESLAGDTAPHFAFNYIALEDVDQGSLRSHSQQVFGSAPSRARRKLRNGDVLVSTVRPNLRSHLLFQGDEHTWVCSTGFCVVRCRAGISHPGYVFFQMFGDAVSNLDCRLDQPRSSSKQFLHHGLLEGASLVAANFQGGDLGVHVGSACWHAVRTAGTNSSATLPTPTRWPRSWRPLQTVEVARCSSALPTMVLFRASMLLPCVV
ncbi:MAG TPA: restriction endonuclease subunit S [Steroidobacter sp.]